MALLLGSSFASPKLFSLFPSLAYREARLTFNGCCVLCPILSLNRRIYVMMLQGYGNEANALQATQVLDAMHMDKTISIWKHHDVSDVNLLMTKFVCKCAFIIAYAYLGMGCDLQEYVC